MSFIAEINPLKERPTPKLWLAKPDFQVIERLNGVSNLNGTFNYMNQDEITFEVNSHLYDELKNEQYKNPAIKMLKNKYMIKFTYLDQTKWFVIDDKSDVSSEKEYIPVTARYIGSELDKKWIGDIEEIGITLRSLFDKYLPIVAPNWRLREVDPKLADVKREYNTSDASISSLIEMACELTDAVVVFHNRDREFSLIHRDNAGKFKGMKVKEATYLKEFTDQFDSKDLTTRLVLFGNEGLTINGVNPSGTSYIEDFSYYMKPFKRDSRRRVIEHSDYMSDELCHALLDFQEYYETQKDSYEDVTEDYSALLTEQLEEEYLLTEITGILRNIEQRIELLKPQGNYVERRVSRNTSFNMMYNTHYYFVIKNEGSLARVTFNNETYHINPNDFGYIKVKTPEQQTPDDPELHYNMNILASNPNLVVALSTSSSVDYEEEDILELDKKYNRMKYQEMYDDQVSILAAVERRMKEYENRRDSIQDSLSAQKFFTPELQKERENFVSWGVYREENHTDPKELLEDGIKKLGESNNVTRTTSVSIIDFFQSLEDSHNWDKLTAGDKIRFYNETYEANYEAFVSEMSIDFDAHDITLTLSDVIDLSDRAKGISQQLASFVSTSNRVDLQGKDLNETIDKTNQVMALLESEWDANNRRILAGDETVDIGSHGIKITSPSHPNEMLIAVAGVIAISNDYGETFKQAINTRGVVAERLIGKVLIGTELVMENDSGTFRFDNDGVRINAANFHLLADDGENYFDKLMQEMENTILSYEDRVIEEMEARYKSVENELKDVDQSLSSYAAELVNSLADGMLTQQEINSLKLQLYMLEANYSQVRNRVVNILHDREARPELQDELYQTFLEFEEDYDKLVGFINALEEPTTVPQETIDEINLTMGNFKPNLDYLVEVIERVLEFSSEQKIQNAEYNAMQFTEKVSEDLNDEVNDLKGAMEEMDTSIKEALADGIITTSEKAVLSDALLRLNSEKRDVDNRFSFAYNHVNLQGKVQKQILFDAKEKYNNTFNSLITKINQIMNLEEVSYEIVAEYEGLYESFTSALVEYMDAYAKATDVIQKQYADTAEGEARKYTDALRGEVEADLEDISGNVEEFREDVYGAFKDGIITEQERNRLGIHHDMLEKEKEDVIERYNTIITSQDLLGHYDTEALVRSRQSFGEVHADLLLSIEVAMMDSKITKEESQEATRLFKEYGERLAEFSIELDGAISAIGEVKAINYTNDQLEHYIDQDVFHDEIAQMQKTIDGHVMTWYYPHEPSLDTLPASDWTTNAIKDKHIGDLFYHTESGYAFRFLKDGSTYKWTHIENTDVVKALADAQDALDLADNKRRVFVARPTTPYDVGDLWIKEDGELMRSRVNRGSGNFANSDWIIATKYTDDTRANQIGNQLDQYKESNNREIKDLKGSLNAFQEVVNGTFRDGIIEEYELRIVQSSITSLQSEKADVDAGYNQLLQNPRLTGALKTRFQTAYQNFASVHNSLVSKINTAVEDGVISDSELDEVNGLFEEYPVTLRSYKDAMNETYLHLINLAQQQADDAIERAGRFDEWESTVFEVETGKIATRVGESSWEEIWKPEVDDAISDISVGGVNLANWTDTTSTNKENYPLVGRAKEISLVTLQGERFFQVRVVEDLDSTNTLGTYVGRKYPTEGYNSYFHIEKGQTYTLTLRGAHSSTTDPFSYVFIMRDDNMEDPDSNSSGANQGVSRAIIDRQNVETGYGSRFTFTFTANWNSRKAYLLIGTHKREGNTGSTSYWFRFNEVQLEKGNKATDWKLSQKDQDDQIDNSIDNFYNTTLKTEYSNTVETKKLLGDYVTDATYKGDLNKVATYSGTAELSGTGFHTLIEANGSQFDDAFSYEVTTRTQELTDSLGVFVLNSKGAGKGWDVIDVEKKGSTGRHPRVTIHQGRPIVWGHNNASGSFKVDYIYTKYAGAFTNIDWANSKIEQTADSITARVNNLQIGGTNLIPQSDFSLYDSPDETNWGVWQSSSGNYLNRLIRYNKVLLLQTPSPNSTNISLAARTPILTEPLIKGKTYTLSWSASTSASFDDSFNYCYVEYDGQSNQSLGNATEIGDETVLGTTANYKRYKITFEASKDGKANMMIGGGYGKDRYAYIYLTEPQLEKGEYATGWSPASTDHNERFSEIQVTADGIQSTVSKKADSDSIISTINQSAEKVAIDADKISLTAGSQLSLGVNSGDRHARNLIPDVNHRNSGAMVGTGLKRAENQNRYVVKSSSSKGASHVYRTGTRNVQERFKAGRDYTVTFQARGNVNVSRIGLASSDSLSSTANWGTDVDIPLDEEFQFIERTITPSTGSSAIGTLYSVILRFTGDPNDWIELKDLTLVSSDEGLDETIPSLINLHQDRIKIKAKNIDLTGDVSISPSTGNATVNRVQQQKGDRRLEIVDGQIYSYTGNILTTRFGNSGADFYYGSGEHIGTIGPAFLTDDPSKRGINFQIERDFLDINLIRQGLGRPIFRGFVGDSSNKPYTQVAGVFNTGIQGANLSLLANKRVGAQDIKWTSDPGSYDQPSIFLEQGTNSNHATHYFGGLNRRSGAEWRVRFRVGQETYRNIIVAKEESVRIHNNLNITGAYGLGSGLHLSPNNDGSLSHAIVGHNTSNALHIYPQRWGGGSDILRIRSHDNRSGYRNELRIRENRTVSATKFLETSEAKEKSNITRWETSALDTINSVQLYKWKMKGFENEKTFGYGFVIGDGYSEPPVEVVAEEGDAISNYAHSSLNTKAIQELSQENKELKERLDRLEEMLLK